MNKNIDRSSILQMARGAFQERVDYEMGRVVDNILDLKGGVRFGPRNNYDFSVNVHDLFNRTSGFSRSVSADHVTNRWTHNFGRYVMFRFVVNFTSMR